jgi:hypothetical protein
VDDERLGDIGEGTPVQVLALTHAVAQVEELVGGDLSRGVDGPLAGVVDDEPPLQVRSSVDLRGAVAALQAEIAVVELLKGFGGLLAAGLACHILERQFEP